MFILIVTNTLLGIILYAGNYTSFVSLSHYLKVRKVALISPMSGVDLSINQSLEFEFSRLHLKSSTVPKIDDPYVTTEQVFDVGYCFNTDVSNSKNIISSVTSPTNKLNTKQNDKKSGKLFPCSFHLQEVGSKFEFSKSQSPTESHMDNLSVSTEQSQIINLSVISEESQMDDVSVTTKQVFDVGYCSNTDVSYSKSPTNKLNTKQNDKMSTRKSFQCPFYPQEVDIKFEFTKLQSPTVSQMDDLSVTTEQVYDVRYCSNTDVLNSKNIISSVGSPTNKLNTKQNDKKSGKSFPCSFHLQEVGSKFEFSKSQSPTKSQMDNLSVSTEQSQIINLSVSSEESQMDDLSVTTKQVFDVGYCSNTDVSYSKSPTNKLNTKQNDKMSTGKSLQCPFYPQEVDSKFEFTKLQSPTVSQMDDLSVTTEQAYDVRYCSNTDVSNSKNIISSVGSLTNKLNTTQNDKKSGKLFPCSFHLQEVGSKFKFSKSQSPTESQMDNLSVSTEQSQIINLSVSSEESQMDDLSVTTKQVFDVGYCSNTDVSYSKSPTNKLNTKQNDKMSTGKFFQCPFCPQKVRSIFSLKRHRKTVCGKIRNPTGKFKCNKCENRYNSLGTLKRHKETSCGKLPQYLCSFCNRKFSQPSCVTRHIENNSCKGLKNSDTANTFTSSNQS